MRSYCHEKGASQEYIPEICAGKCTQENDKDNKEGDGIDLIRLIGSV